MLAYCGSYSLPVSVWRGCELIEWLLSWAFVSSREDGCQLANSLLNEAYIQPVGGISKDSYKKNSHSRKIAFVDGVTALYRFVSKQ